MNALQLLKEDHNRISALFEQLQDANDFSEKRELFQELRQELDLHTQLEENLFYPRCAEFDEISDLIDESYEDHHEIRELIQELDDISEEREFDDKLEELVDAVEGHVEDEESDLFPKVEELIDSDELDELGARIEEERRSISSAAA